MTDSENSNTTASTENTEKNPNDLEKLQEEVSKWKNEYLYLRAEFENYKKNALKERSDLIKYGSERLSKDILDVVDNFDRALDAAASSDNLESFKTGMAMTSKELKDTLLKHGISEIPSLGQPFNPQFFEAISSEANPDFTDGAISKIFKKAYKMHDKIIRMGQVVVNILPKGDN